MWREDKNTVGRSQCGLDLGSRRLTMKRSLCAMLAFVPHRVLSFSTLSSPFFHQRGSSPRSLKRPRTQDCSSGATIRKTSHLAVNTCEWEGEALMELDVVEYKMQGTEEVQLGSYIGDGKLQPLLTREESGPHLFFHDEGAQPVSVTGGMCRILRVLDEVYFSQRIVEDRVKSPHGEEAEDCFLVEGTLHPSLVIKVE